MQAYVYIGGEGTREKFVRMGVQGAPDKVLEEEIRREMVLPSDMPFVGDIEDAYGFIDFTNGYTSFLDQPQELKELVSEVKRYHLMRDDTNYKDIKENVVSRIDLSREYFFEKIFIAISHRSKGMHVSSCLPFMIILMLYYVFLIF